MTSRDHGKVHQVLAVLVHGAPEVLTLAANRHKEFVQMPRVAHGPGPMPKPSCVREARGLGLVPDGFVETVMPRLREDVFDVSEAQIEAVVDADRVAH